MPGIIKSDGTLVPQSAATAAAFNFDDLTVRAERYLDEVRQQAAQILAQASRDATRLREEARVQGRRDAVAEAERSMHARLDQQLERQSRPFSRRSLKFSTSGRAGSAIGNKTWCSLPRQLPNA